MTRSARTMLMSSILLLLVSGSGQPSPASERGTAAPVAFGTTIAGTDRALVARPEGVDWRPYGNAGYDAIAVGDRIEVSVTLREIGDSSPFSPPQLSKEATPLEKIAHKQTAGARTHYEASARILNWVSRNIQYELDRTKAQDAETVLQRRTAYCTGIARLTVALFASVGIPSREVPGVVFDGRFAGLHRWVEHRLPESGWVFSDPLASHFWVPATYLRLDSGALDTQGPPRHHEMLARQDDTSPVDVHALGPHWILARANRPEQQAPALEVVLDGAPIAHARLRGGGREHVARLHRGRAVFVGLEPASYTLHVEPQQTGHDERLRMTTARKLDISDNVRHAVRLVGRDRALEPFKTSGGGEIALSGVRKAREGQ